MEDTDIYVVEKEYNPKAVYDYVNYDSDESGKKGAKKLVMKAKKHLSAVGWVFYYFHMKSGRRELRYCPPNRKKKYNSLKMACKDYLHNEFGENNFQLQNINRDEDVDNDLVSRDWGQAKKKFKGFNEGLVSGDLGQSNDGVEVKKLRGSDKGLVTHNLGPDESDNVYGKPVIKLKIVFNGHNLGDNRTDGVPHGVDDGNLGQNQINCVYSKPVKKLKFVNNGLVTPGQSHSDGVYYKPVKKLNDLATKNLGENRNNGVYYKRKKKPKGANSDLATQNLGLGQNQDAVYDKPGKELISVNNVLPTQNLEQNHDGVYHKQMERPKGVNNDLATQNLGIHQNDDVCLVCLYGGELILCDKCPSAFHAQCIGLMEIPNTEFWYCPSCCCKICSRGDDAETTYSYKQCNQCEKQYHEECLRHYCVADLDKSEWFCSKKCRDISNGLRNLLGKSVVVGRNNLSWTILKNENNMNDAESTNKKMLHRALVVMHECFKFIKRGRDVVEDVIFSRKSELKRLDCCGFYTVILKKGNTVVTVATVRVFGEEVAEVPLVATRFRYRRQGMCKILMNVLEQKLMELGVEKLVLPAIPSVLDTWTGPSFGFSKMIEFDRWTLLNYNFLEFPGTVICQKLLSEDEISSVMDSPSN